MNPVVGFSASTTANRVFWVMFSVFPLSASVNVNIFFPSAAGVTVNAGLQPSLRKSAHSSQEVPFLKVHMPYSLPDISFFNLKSAPAWPQDTDPGFGIPMTVCVAVGDCVPGGVTACWVQPHTSITSTSRIPSPKSPDLNVP